VQKSGVYSSWVHDLCDGQHTWKGRRMLPTYRIVILNYTRLEFPHWQRFIQPVLLTTLITWRNGGITREDERSGSIYQCREESSPLSPTHRNTVWLKKRDTPLSQLRGRFARDRFSTSHSCVYGTGSSFFGCARLYSRHCLCESMLPTHSSLH
jgi:hypothetical protein